MLLFTYKPKIEYIQLFQNENMYFAYEDFDRLFIPTNKKYLQFSVLFSINLVGISCTQNYMLSVLTKDFIKNVGHISLYGKYLEIDIYENWKQIESYIENIVLTKTYGSCNDMQNQLNPFFNPTKKWKLND